MILFSYYTISYNDSITVKCLYCDPRRFTVPEFCDPCRPTFRPTFCGRRLKSETNLNFLLGRSRPKGGRVTIYYRLTCLATYYRFIQSFWYKGKTKQNIVISPCITVVKFFFQIRWYVNKWNYFFWFLSQLVERKYFHNDEKCTL